MGTAITYGPLQHGRGIQRHCDTASDTYCDTAGWLVRRKSRRGLGESPERPAKGGSRCPTYWTGFGRGSTPGPRVAPQLAERLAVWGPEHEGTTHHGPHVASAWIRPGWKWGTGVGGKAQLECRPVECPSWRAQSGVDLVRAHRGVSRRRGPADADPRWGRPARGPQRRTSRQSSEAGGFCGGGWGRGVTHPHGETRRTFSVGRPAKSKQETTRAAGAGGLGLRGTRASATGPLSTQSASNTPTNTTSDTQSYGCTTRHVGRFTWQERESFSMRGPLLSWQLALQAHTQLNW